jgi:hypothetical protein
MMPAIALTAAVALLIHLHRIFLPDLLYRPHLQRLLLPQEFKLAYRKVSVN